LTQYFERIFIVYCYTFTNYFFHFPFNYTKFYQPKPEKIPARIRQPIFNPIKNHYDFHPINNLYEFNPIKNHYEFHPIKIIMSLTLLKIFMSLTVLKNFFMTFTLSIIFEFHPIKIFKSFTLLITTIINNNREFHPIENHYEFHPI